MNGEAVLQLGLLARIAGPKVLLGVSAASIAAIAVLTWMMLSAQEDAAQAQAQNAQLRTTVNEQSKDHERLRVELDRRDEAVAAANEARREIREQSRNAISDLQKALKNDTCANRPHPDAVTDSLRIGAGGTNQD